MADVGIRDGKIAAIGDLSLAPAPARVVDGGGNLVAAPGFVDIHAHSEFSLLIIDGLAQSKVR